MAKIFKLSIQNFRGIKEFAHVFHEENFICLIGRGDSGKSTILKAISYVLSPNWNLPFMDSDFFNGNISNDIKIEVTLVNFPDSFIQEDKFGLQLRGIDKETGQIEDELQDHHEKALTIRLSVNKDLEPIWEVINDRMGDNRPIKSSDREKLNTFLVADSIDNHFSWNRGTLLNSLFKRTDNEIETIEKNIIINALRSAKFEIDSNPFSHFEAAITEINSLSTELGIDLGNVQPTLAFKEIFIKDGKAYLHDGNVPFNLKGKGSRRLTSISIQLALMKEGGIILVDEVEQGLEPDRTQHLIRTLKEKNMGQIFVTTHSRDVLVELSAKDIFLKRVGSTELINFNEDLQGVIRSNPESFFAEKVIVCEGPTEIGIVRSINQFRIKNGKKSYSTLGVRFANGSGSSQVAYAKGFINAGYEVCLFCDSDVEDVNTEKGGLRHLGVKIIDAEQGNSIEEQLFKDLPWGAVTKLINYAISERSEDSIHDSFCSKYRKIFQVEPSPNWRNMDSEQIRQCLGIVSSKSGWFKRIDHGEFLGNIICDCLPDLVGKRLKTEVDNISNWVDA